MTDTPTNEAPARRKKKGPGSGKVAPTVVLSGTFGEDKPPPKRTGRPSTYTEAVGAYICEQLEIGRSVNSLLHDEGTPDRSTLVNWLALHPEFSAKYARAREIGYDVFAERLMARAVDVPPELAQSRKLEIDTGKWLLGKMCQRYSDRVNVRQEISGPGGQPIALQVDVLVNMLLTPANLERLTDVEVESIRSAAAKLALPPPAAGSGAGPPIEGEFSEVEPADTPVED